MLRITRRETHILFIYALKVVTHYHYAAITRALTQIDDGRGVLPNAGRSFSRVKRRVRVQAAASGNSSANQPEIRGCSACSVLAWHPCCICAEFARRSRRSRGNASRNVGSDATIPVDANLWRS